MTRSGNAGSIGAVLVVIASTSHCLDIPKQKRSPAFSRDTARLELQKPIFGNFDFQIVTTGNARFQGPALGNVSWRSGINPGASLTTINVYRY